MAVTFKPISESMALPEVGERILVSEGGVKTVALQVEARAGEEKRYSLVADVDTGCALHVNLFVRGEGDIFIDRTINVLGEGAKVFLTCTGIISGTGRILAADDVHIQAHGAFCDIRTKIVLKDSAVSEARSRMTLLPSAAASTASARIDHLILGDHARGFAIPELDVQTDDVICTHGATSAGLPEESLGYLLGRGLDESAATDLLVHGFLNLE